MRDCRAALGETAKFSIQFAGNPIPGIVCQRVLVSGPDVAWFRF